MKFKIRNFKFGFTLVELLVIIAIMSVLSTIIYASFNTARAKSRDQKRVSDISLISLALEQYFNRYGQYPVSTSSLSTGGNKFLPYWPVTPNSYSQYNYFPIAYSNVSGSPCISYHLWTKLEASSSYLISKKGFSSSPLPTGLYDCGGGHTGINALNTSLIYDVIPQ